MSKHPLGAWRRLLTGIGLVQGKPTAFRPARQSASSSSSRRSGMRGCDSPGSGPITASGSSCPQSTRIVQRKRRPTSNVGSMMVLRARRGGTGSKYVTLRGGLRRAIPFLLVRSGGCARSSILCGQDGKTVLPACVLPGEKRISRDGALGGTVLDKTPYRDAEFLGLVGEVGGDAGARKGDDADGQGLDHLVVALEGCGVAVPRPVGLEDDLGDLAVVGPAGGDALGAPGAAAVHEPHVRVLGTDFVEGVPDAGDIVAVGAAGKGDTGAGRSEDFRV